MSTLKLGKQIETKLERVEENILGALDAVTRKSDQSKQIEDKIASMEEAVMGKMSEQQLEVEKSLKEHNEIAKSMPKIQTELTKSTQELKKFIEKKQDMETREVNIIIHNVPESQSSEPAERKKYDTDSFQNIVQALLGQDTSMDTQKVYRLGQEEGSW